MNRFSHVLGSCFLGLCLLLFSTALLAQTYPARSDPGRDDWDTLLQATSIEASLRQMPGYFRQGMEQAKAQGAPIAPETFSALNAAAEEVYRFETLREMAREHLKTSLSPAQLASWLAFYRTPLGQKLSAADARASAPEFQAQLMERGPQLLEALSREPGRMALLQSWLQATDALEQATNMALQTQLALEWGMVSTLPQPMGKPTFAELQRHFEEQRFVVRAQMAQFMLAYAAAAYEDFSQDELGQLLKQANSPQARALYIDFSRKLHQTLAALGEKTGQLAGQRLAQQAI